MGYIIPGVDVFGVVLRRVSPFVYLADGSKFYFRGGSAYTTHGRTVDFILVLLSSLSACI